MAAKPTLLLDGDVFAYVAASAAQQNVEYPEDGFIYRWSFKHEGEAVLNGMLKELQQKFDAEEMLVYLTETTPMSPNWRSELLPDYKGNRDPQERPQLLAHLRGYLREKWGAASQPGLEADDLLGMRATSFVKYGSGAPPIIVTKDKDLRSIPGRLHIMGRYDKNTGAPIVETVTESEALTWHMAQTLAGDRIDNYSGCPGIGMTRALRILEAPVVLYPEDGIVTRGPRKGERTTKWMSRKTKDVWACVVSHYVKEGLSEEDALRNARVAHILHCDDYDWRSGRVRLWEPYR